MAKGLSAAKAKKILTDGYIKGKPLTAKQRKYFGAIASGATPLKAINGGWLDKYQDGGSVTKAQDGTEVEETLTVESKDDPRYKAYQDSLEVYNDYKKVQKSLLKNNYKLERHSVSNPDYLAMKKKMLKEKGIDASNWDGEGANILTKRGSKAFEALENLKPKYVKHINKDKYKVLDLQDDMVNTNLPMQLFNKNIDPIGVTEYIDKDKYWTGTSPDNYEFNGTGNLYNVGLNIMGGSQDVRSVFNYSNAKPRQKVVVEQNSQKDRIETKLTPSKETPKRPIEEPLSQLDSYGIEPFKPNLELLTSGDIEAQPIYQHKPYNQNDKPIPLGLLQKMGIENPESQGFHYIKELNGNFKTMQTREAYRKDNLRPNNTPYPPKAQNGIKEAINKYLGDPQGEAREFAENPDELANIDNMRHAQATRLTQEAIANKTGNIPLISDALGLLGSNALGIGHELTTLFGDKDKRDWSTKLQESGEDVLNNLFGSVIGSLPIDDKTKDDVIKYASYNNMLPDGYVRGEQGEEDGLSENVYFKNEDNEVRRPEYKSGGWLDKYENGGDVEKAQNGKDEPSSDMFLPSPEEQLKRVQLEASGFPMDQYVPPNSRKQKTSYQTKKEFHKDQLETNPNRLKGESEEMYKLRQQQFANRIKEYDAKFNKYLKKPGIGKALFRGYNNLKEEQNKLPWIPRTLSEVITSPFDVGFKSSNSFRNPKRNSLLNENQKNQDLYSLAGSGLDAVNLYTLGGSLITNTLAKQVIPNVGLILAKKELITQGIEDAVGEATGLSNGFKNGGSLPGASGMMYGRTSSNASMEPGKLKKAQTGDTYDWEKIRENSPSFLENFTEPTIKPIEEKPKSFYDSLLNDAVISSGGTTEDWEKLSGMISYHESKNDPLAKQKVKKTKDNPTGIGLGRGLYQFEPDSFKTAANRAYNYSKETGLELPQFIKDIRSKKIKEASELTPDQQKTLLLADYRDKPTAKLKAFFSGDKDDQAIEDFWVTGHWSGGNKDEQERRTSFKADASTYNNLYSKKKNGGWLDKYEDGGDVPKAQNGNFGGVNTDVQTTSGESATSEEPAYELVFPDDSNYDDRYKETYEGGAFATYPNQLDEVVINSGVDYNKDIYYDTLTDQEKDLYHNDYSPIGNAVRRKAQTKRGLAEDALAIPGQLLQGALETAQAPQAAMVEGIEALRGNDYNFSNALPGSGMQRLPSQAFGFEDKPGWDLGGSINTAMDVVADPTNLVGVGLYDDIVKLGLKATPKLNSIAKTFGKYSDDLIDKTKNISKFNSDLAKDFSDIDPKWWELGGVNKPDVEMNNIFSRILDKLPKKVRETYASRVKGITKASDLPRLDPSEFDILKNIDEVMTLREMGGSRQVMLERALKSNLDDPILESIFYKNKKQLQSELDDLTSTIPKPKKVVGTLDSTEEGVEQAIENVNRYGVVQLNPDISGFSLNRPSTPSRSSVDIDTMVRNIYDDVDNVDNLVTGNVATKTSQINEAVTEIPNRVRQSKPAPKNSTTDVEDLSGQDLANISSYPYVKPGGFTEELVPLVKLGPHTSKRDYANMVKDARARVRMSNRGDIFTGSTDTSYQSYLPQLNEVFSPKMKGVADPIFLGYKPMNPMGNINRAAGNSSRSVTRGINENIAAYLNNQIDTNISKIKLPDDLLRPFFQNSSGEVMLPQYGLRKLKKGGVIKDDMGQWAHPGEVTEISGNTMATHGYGDNPLYVVPDVGEPRMVQANTGTQTFPGATKFTEYPMAKNGSSLVELNQLTNFTNYNTPQSGGWLDKYN